MDSGSSALRYHEATKHSELSLGRSAHYLDWDTKPAPFKIYHSLPTFPLPRSFPLPTKPALDAIRGQVSSELRESVGVQDLAEILFFSAGLTRKMRFGNEQYYMRAASATGALYPIELYPIVSGVLGLEPGIYHLNPLEFSLVQIRKGDYGPELSKATDATTSSCPVSIALTSVAWRNSWKYEERSYRHWFWDSGVIAANLLATCHSVSLTARLMVGFVDSAVDRLLGLKNEKEASVVVVAIGEKSGYSLQRPIRTISELDPEIDPTSGEIEYPIIWQTNSASKLDNQSSVVEWRHGHVSPNSKPHSGHPTFELGRLTQDSPALTDAILRRGSTRRFTQRPISFEILSSVLDSSSRHISTDFLSDNSTLTEFYFIANAVEGLPSGSYYFDQRSRSVEQLKAGRLRDIAGYLCLGQPLFSDASAVFFLMSNLKEVLDSFGDRGYRAAQFEAGVRAGKIYLSSYALGIGASGSTFFDDAVTDFFSPHAERLSTMIAVGIGEPAYKARPGKILPQFPSSKAIGLEI